MKDSGNQKKKHRKGGGFESVEESYMIAEQEWESLKGSLGVKKTKATNSPKSASGKSGQTKQRDFQGRNGKGPGTRAKSETGDGKGFSGGSTGDKKITVENKFTGDRSTSNREGRRAEDIGSRYNKDRRTGEKASSYSDNKRDGDRNFRSKEREYKDRDGRKTSDRREGKGGNPRTKKDDGKCAFLKQCGTCNMRQEYQVQLEEKQKTVNSLLGKFCKVEPIVGMENPYHYRNKVHAVFHHDRKGNPISGVYEEGTHNVIPIDSCMIHNKKADEIIVSIRGLLKSFKIKTYDEDTEYGLLRHVLIRTGFHSGEIMVVLVLADPILPSKNNFVKALRKLHPEITTIVININDKRTNMVLGDREQVIYGKGYIEDTLCDKVFHISPKSFYQVNSLQTEVIYRKAIELAGLTGKETVIDAYCGIGTIGLIAADHAKKVLGIELNKDAIKDAIINAKRNKVSNTEFICQDAGDAMNRMASVNETVDVVFMDPPRAGSDEQFLGSLCLMGPKRVVYISCNPVTLERDLQFLVKKGYKVETAVPVDMFPWTGHVETVVLMSRKDK